MVAAIELSPLARRGVLLTASPLRTTPAQVRRVVQDAQRGEAVAYRRCRLGILGDGGMGKTATQRALTGQPFDDSIGSTVGAARHTCELDTRQVCGALSRQLRCDTFAGL